MIFGYARTSTDHQEAGLEDQQKRLQELGCDRVVSEEVSALAKRPGFEGILQQLRPGDVLVVTKLDRMARSVVHLGAILQAVEEAGATLRILDLNVDTGDATGRLMLNLMGSVAQFEREMILERQKAGIRKARAAGKYKGRKPKFALAKAKELRESGLSLSEIAHRLGVTRQAVHARLKEATQ